jgi:UbiD family decarboxylase
VQGRVPRTTNQPNVKKTPLSAKRTKRLVDLYNVPISLHTLKDGGQYLDASLVVVRNPDTGVPNISIHRMMVAKVVFDAIAPFSKTRTFERVRFKEVDLKNYEIKS